MRNRVYLPRLMRFAQRDPNATGQLVMAAVMHSGQSMSAHPGGMQLESLFGDGPNLHDYLAGRPRGNSDPTGLFMAGDLVASAAMVGVRGLRGGLEGMTEHYAANLEDDLDWAMDWSRPDNDYSRLSSTWVGQSFMDGMYGGLEDGLGDALSDFSFGLWPVTHEKHGPAMAGLFAPSKVGGVTGKMTSRGLRVLGKTLRTFRTKVFNIGSTKFILDKAGLSHILKRHHRDVWDKTVGQKAQTFFSDGMSINSVVKAIEAVVIQNRSNLARIPNGRGQVEGIFQGKRYILGVTDERIGQFYPLPD